MLQDRVGSKRNPAAFVLLRLCYLGCGVAFFILVYLAGTGVTMTVSEAEEYTQALRDQVQNIDESALFLNNMAAALGMFIPAAGVGIGGYAGYSTGIMFSALVTITPELSGISPLAVLSTPFGILEVLAYGLAISRSGLLAFQLIKRKPWREYIVYTLVEMGIVVAALIAGSVIEAQVIREQ